MGPGCIFKSLRGKVKIAELFKGKDITHVLIGYDLGVKMHFYLTLFIFG